jgi:hypothetical protein
MYATAPSFEARRVPEFDHRPGEGGMLPDIADLRGVAAIIETQGRLAAEVRSEPIKRSM